MNILAYGGHRIRHISHSTHNLRPAHNSYVLSALFSRAVADARRAIPIYVAIPICLLYPALLLAAAQPDAAQPAAESAAAVAVIVAMAPNALA